MTLLVLIFLHVKHQLTSNPLFILLSVLWQLVHSIQYQMILRRSWVAMEFEELFLNWGNMSYKCHCSAKYPNVSKLHFWNSRSGVLIWLKLCMCQWQAAVVEAHQTYGEDTDFWQWPPAPPPSILCFGSCTWTYQHRKAYTHTQTNA